ncbi:MAG: TIGR03088 family PEP-CTERM/XrtA system glycosyltransferase [Gammaproteobacteria bacterium]|nr:TIGR03088 family PEP-CTERM/XrtA system glycosyltransferase [Gammaproteobacteria bacterium]
MTHREVQRAPLIAHVVHRFDYGGLENGIVNLVNRMPERSYAHAIVALAGCGEEFTSRIDRDRVQVLSIDKLPGKDLPAYGRMWRALRRLRPTIVHTRNLGTLDMQWVAAAAAVQHRVHGEHGWDAGDPRGLNPRSLRLRRACAPLIHRYVAMSMDIERWLTRDVGIAGGRIRQIYNGVDTLKFYPREAAATGAAGDTAHGLITIGTVGRLDPIKNQAQLLHACREILDRHPEYQSRLRLVIVGDGPSRGTLQSLVDELRLADIVSMPGARNDVAALMRGMDIFVLPSVNEGISNTILEAMATGLPVIASRVGGNPELVVDGVTGAVSEQDRFGAVIQRYLANPELRAQHGAAGRARAVERFSLDAMVQGYVELYDEVLYGRTNGRPARNPMADK